MAMNDPVVVSDPTTGTVGQPRLASDTSISPDSLRHEEVTFQTPVTSPPQGESPVQVGPAPPLLAPPPPTLELPPLEGAPALPALPLPLLHAIAAPEAANRNMLKSPKCSLFISDLTLAAEHPAAPD